MLDEKSSRPDPGNWKPFCRNRPRETVGVLIPRQNRDSEVFWAENPDAFVCVSDFVAFVTLSLLADRGYRVPEDVRLTGYDDSQDFMLDNHKISTVHVQNGLLGKRMVHQLLYRIDNPTADFEEIFIYPKVLNKN